VATGKTRHSVSEVVSHSKLELEENGVTYITLPDFLITIGRPTFSIAPSSQSSYVGLRVRADVLSNDETNLADESFHSRLFSLIS